MFKKGKHTMILTVSQAVMIASALIDMGRVHVRHAVITLPSETIAGDALVLYSATDGLHVRMALPLDASEQEQLELLAAQERYKSLEHFCQAYGV